MNDDPAASPEDPRPHRPPTGPRRLRRSRSDRVIGGVCAGVARYGRIDPVIVRVLAVVLLFVGGAGAIAYVAMLLLVPDEAPGDAVGAAEGEAPDRRLSAGVVVLIVALLVVGGPFILGGGLVAVGLAVPLALAALVGSAAWWLVSGEPVSSEPLELARRSALGLLVLTACATLVGAGFLATGFGGGSAAGAAVIAAGIVLVVGAFTARVRWVVLPAVALALGATGAAAASVDLRGGVGHKDFRPTTDLRPSYDVGVGQLIVDLRGTTLPRGDTNLRLRVGMGEVVVVVPTDVCVATRADLGAGSVEVFGRPNGGVDYHFAEEPQAGRRGRRVVLDTHIGFGELVVAHDREVLGESDRRPFNHDSLRADVGNLGCAGA